MICASKSAVARPGRQPLRQLVVLSPHDFLRTRQVSPDIPEKGVLVPLEPAPILRRRVAFRQCVYPPERSAAQPEVTQIRLAGTEGECLTDSLLKDAGEQGRPLARQLFNHAPAL